MRGYFTAAVLAAATMAAAPASAVVIFSEDFEDEIAATGGSVLNFTGFDQFTVTDGTVDLIESGDGFGITCAGMSMGCVDLDGSTNNPGVMSKSLEFINGMRYVLSFDMSGSQRTFDFSALFDQVEVAVSGILSAQTIVTANGDPWTSYVYEFVGNGTTAPLTFSNFGNDNVGAVLDNVSVAAVPVPGALAMLGGALAGLGLLRRRRG